MLITREENWLKNKLRKSNSLLGCQAIFQWKTEAETLILWRPFF
jgi:hypothetical protein